MRRGIALCASVATLACAGQAKAQAVLSPAPEAAAGTVVYNPTSYPDANTAEDILRRIPGLQTILDPNAQGRTQERGFGSAGAQVLLNGRRFPGKANEISANLRRIPASNVLRVELISGAAEGISVQNQGLLVNLVLREGAGVGGSGNWELNGRFNDEGRFNVDGLISYSRAFGALTVGGGIERNVWSPTVQGPVRWTDRFRNEVYYYPNGTIQELRPQTWVRSYSRWTFTGNSDYEFANGATVTLNGLYETPRFLETDETPLIRYSPAGVETLRALEYHERENPGSDIFEVSGEYNTGFGPGDFAGLFIVRRDTTPTLDFRTRNEPARDVEVSRSDSLVKTGEDIVRGSYTVPVGAVTLLLGAEGARNTLNQHLDVFFDFNNDGRLEPATIPIADPEVKELRGELFSNVKWQATPRLSVDASLNYEYSRLTTNYPFQPKRTLGFLKPRLDVRYRPSPRTQFRALVERTVSQLNFANFVPSYNLTDDRVESGNPALEPSKTWGYELGFERRLANDGGLIDIRAFYDDITDAIDKVPLLDSRGVLVSASGNIPSARSYGLEARVSLRLGFAGLPGAQLSLRGLRQWTRIQDPFTGLPRRMSADSAYIVDVGFRHDLPRRRMSYGFTYNEPGLQYFTSDLLVSTRTSFEPRLEAFVERALWGNVTLRLELENLTHVHWVAWRTRYLVNAIDGRVRRVDLADDLRDRRGTLRIRGRF